jgi:hypothetical protein
MTDDHGQFTPEKQAAVMQARGDMCNALEREFPGDGAQLYDVACSGGTCDQLRNPEIAPDRGAIDGNALHAHRAWRTDAMTLII